MSNFRGNVLKLVNGSVAAHAVGFLALPLLSRLFDPQAFGLLQLFQASLSLPLVMLSLRYEVALLEPPEDATFLLVLQLCYWVMACMLVVTVGLWLLIASGLLAIPAKFELIYGFIPFGLVAGGLLQVAGYISLRQKSFGVIAAAKLLQVAGFSGVAVLAGFLFPRMALALLFADVVGRMTAAFVCIRQDMGAHGRLLRTRLQKASLLEIAVKYKNFPILYLPGDLLSAIGAFIAPMSILTLYGAATTGQYALVERSISVPLAVLAGAIAQAHAAQFSDDLRNRSAGLLSSVRAFALKLLLIGVLPSLALAVLGPLLIELVFGSQWLVAGSIAQWMVPVFLSTFVVFPLNMALTLLGEQRMQLVWQAIRLGLVASVWFSASRLN